MSEEVKSLAVTFAWPFRKEVAADFKRAMMLLQGVIDVQFINADGLEIKDDNGIIRDLAKLLKLTETPARELRIDDAVYDQKNEEGSLINNDGLEDQLRYLAEGYLIETPAGREAFIRHLGELLDEPITFHECNPEEKP